MATLRFRFDPEKFVNAVAYLSRNCPSSTKLTICKHLYLADREHLVRYGRPIVGDQYYKLPHGPVPSRGLNMLRGKASAPENALLEQFVSIVGNAVHPKRLPNRKVFSQSDWEILEWVVEKYGTWSAKALRDLTHKQAPWTKTVDAAAIDYALFFDGQPDALRLNEMASAEQESRDLLRHYAKR